LHALACDMRSMCLLASRRACVPRAHAGRRGSCYCLFVSALEIRFVVVFPAVLFEPSVNKE
jgi:hypothetical protein